MFAVGAESHTVMAGVARQDISLSFAQQRLWFITKLEPGALSYSVPFCLRLTGELEITVLERSLRHIVSRHEVLRTTYPEVHGQPVQRIVSEARRIFDRERGAGRRKCRNRRQQDRELPRCDLVALVAVP